MSETPKSRIFRLATLLKWGKSRRGYWYVLAVLVAALTFMVGGNTAEAQQGQTANQHAMQRYIETHPNEDVRNVLVDLRAAWVQEVANTQVMPTFDPINYALDQMSGSIYGTMTTASFQNTVMFHNSLANVIRRDSNTVSAAVHPNRSPAGNMWGTLYGNVGTMHADGNVGKYTQGFSGILAGFDRLNDRQHRLGVFISLGGGSLYGEYQDRTLTQEIMVGHYLRRDTGNTYVLVQAGLAHHLYNTKRTVMFGGWENEVPHVGYRTARNQHNALLATGHFETGLKYRGGTLNLSPFVGAQCTGLVREGFTEHGSTEILSLTADMQGYVSLRTMFGMRFDSQSFRFRNGLASVFGNVAWMYEFDQSGKRHTKFAAQFSNAGLMTGAPKFAVRGNEPGRDWVQTGFGVNYDIDADSRAFIGYDAYANLQQVMHTFSLGYLFQW